MRRLKTWLPNLLLVSLALTASVFLAEAAVRIIAPRSTSVAYQTPYGLGIHYPGITRYMPQYGHAVSINSVGMRDIDHTKDKPDGTYRVLVLGDSFMEAFQVPLEASLPRLLERGLNQGGPGDVEVINAAVSGWGTEDALRYLTRYGMEYEPDLVLVAMTLHNDVSDNLRESWYTVLDGRLLDKTPPKIPFIEFKTLQVKALIATRMQLYQLWRRVRHSGEMEVTAEALDQHIVELFQEPARERIEWGLDFTGLLLEEIDSVAAAGSAEFAVVLLPLMVQLSDQSFSDFATAGGLPLATVDPDRPQRAVARMAADTDALVIDLLPAFREWASRSEEALYIDGDGHWNEAGHELAAETVLDRLLDAGYQR